MLFELAVGFSRRPTIRLRRAKFLGLEWRLDWSLSHNDSRLVADNIALLCKMERREWSTGQVPKTDIRVGLKILSMSFQCCR